MNLLHLIFAAPCLYVIARWLVPLTLPMWAKGGLAIALLIGSQYHLWARLSSGSVFAPEFPRIAVMALNWFYGAILLLAVMQILTDLGALALATARRRIIPIADWLRYGAMILAALLATIGTAEALRVPPVKDIEVSIPNLPPQFDGYRVLQLTDLHISRMFPAAWTREMVTRANATGVDLIVVTGDFIDGSVAARRDDVEPLRALQAPDGIYAIPGNHEYYFDYSEWMKHLADIGVRMLSNTHAVLARGQGRVVIAGVTDVDAPQFGKPGPDLKAALLGAPVGAPVLLLDHEPRNAKEAAAGGVALQLSGHTHGGMVLGLDRLVALSNGGFVSGRYQVGRMTLYVSNGTALWPGFAIRLGRSAEMTRITLRASRPDQPKSINQ